MTYYIIAQIQHFCNQLFIDFFATQGCFLMHFDDNSSFMIEKNRILFDFCQSNITASMKIHGINIAQNIQFYSIRNKLPFNAYA